jgi:hypothetical protein
VACWYPRWRICALSDHQYGHARARRGATHNICQFGRNLVLYSPESRQATVSLRNALLSLSPCHDHLFAGRYYRLVMYYYALALRRSSFLMVNSSWTKNHVDAILAHSDPHLDLIHLPLTSACSLALSAVRTLAHSSPSRVHATPKRALIVYPPCDTLALSHFPLDERPSLLLSLAQFRYNFRLFFLARHVHWRKGQKRTMRHRFA